MTDIDKVIERIKKAMRLAQKAGTDGERVAAENAAKRLAAANGIALESITVTDSEAKSVEVEGEDVYTLTGCEVGYSVNLIREHFAVVMVMRQTGRKIRYTYFGSPLNIEIAKYVYLIVMRESRSAWRRAQKNEKLKSEVVQRMYGIAAVKPMKKDSFMNGFFYAIHKRLQEHPLRNDLDQFAEEKKSAERKFEEFKKRVNVTNQKQRHSAYDDAALNAGYQAGKSVSLNRPCEGNGRRAEELTRRFQIGMGV